MKEFEKDIYLEYLADAYEIPEQQAMLVIAVIEVCENLGYMEKDWDIDGTIASIFDKVFKR